MLAAVPFVCLAIWAGCSSPSVLPNAQNDSPKSARTLTPEAKIYAKSKPAVVTVLCGPSKGSGFLFDASGLILTNAHVVQSGDPARVKIYDGQIYRTLVLAKDDKADVAVLWANPKAVAGITLLPLASATDEPPFEGERLVAIGSPLHQEVIVTSGIVSKVTPDAILSNININHGNSGGPVLNMDGKVVGIATFIDPGGNGPGVSGIIRIEVAQASIEAAKKALDSAAVPSAIPLPQPRKPALDDEHVTAEASKLKRKEAPFLKAPRNFRTYIDTPFIVRKVALEELKDWQRTVGRRYKNSAPPKFSPPTSAFWRKYVGEENTPTVALRIIPWPMETSGSQWATVLGALVGSANTHKVYEFRDDIARVEVLVNGKAVEPYSFRRLLQSQFVETSNVTLNDAAYGALIELDPLVFMPGNKVVLHVWKNDRKDPDVIAFPESLQKEIWAPFQSWFDRLPESERTVAPKT